MSWQEITGARGATILGMYNLATITNNLKSLQPVTVEIAQLLLRGGHEAIDGANAGAKQPWYKPNLPGDNSRATVSGKLAWHDAHLAQSSHAPNAMYDAADDLKKWVTQAYIEANAVEEGAAYLDASWNRMWSDIQTQLKAIPHAVVALAAAAAGEVGGAILGVPPWAFWVSAALGVSILGWGIWKIANSGAGQAAIRGYTGGLVGRRK